MLKRKAMDKLLAWKLKRKGCTALLLEGARRVGKSTLVREFGKSYRSMLVLDFSVVSEDVKALFLELRQDLPRFYEALAAITGVRLFPRESVIVFDEVQAFPQARELVKHLVADGSYDIVETGSLLSIENNIKDIIIPSEEERIRLNPLDFEEFLWGMDEVPLSEFIRESFIKKQPLPQGLHRKAQRLFREYLLVGGMPQAVNVYRNTKSFLEVDDIHRQILSLYRQDGGKFAGRYRQKVSAIFDEIPAQLSKHEKRFTLSSIAKNARMRSYETAFFWLTDAQIINPCYASSDPSVGLGLSQQRTSVKCYMADTGLLVSHALQVSHETPETIFKAVLLGQVQLNEGMLVENVVAQSLVALGDRLFFYAQGKESGSPLEIDFLVIRPFANAEGKPRVVPIEVKSSTRFSTVSLDRFEKKMGSKVGESVVIYPGELRREARRVYIPLYMMHCL